MASCVIDCRLLDSDLAAAAVNCSIPLYTVNNGAKMRHFLCPVVVDFSSYFWCESENYYFSMFVTTLC